MHTSILRILQSALLTVFTAAATAQCTAGWLLPSFGLGVSGSVETFCAWDPDGAGPQPQLVVIGGLFGQAGTVAASNLAFYDPATQSFTAPAAGLNGRVLAALGLANGDLVVGGEFTQAGTTPGTGGVARWDGTNWHALAGGVGGTVRALLELPNGNVVAGGTFQTAGGGLTVNHVAQWNGTAWSALGQGVQQPLNPILPAGVSSIVQLPGGDVLAGGNFTQAGAVASHTIARWNGAAWSTFDAGLTLWLRTRQLFQGSGGALYAVGDVASPTASSGVVEWNGTSWIAPGGFPNYVDSLAETAGGTLVAAVSGPAVPSQLAELSPTGWTTIATAAGAGAFRAVLALPGLGPDDVIVGGAFTAISGQAASNLALRVGGTWLASSSGPNGAVNAFASAPDGTLYVGGGFSAIDGVALSNVASWNGASWQALGSGTDNPVISLAVAPDGDLYAAGVFQNAGGVPAPGLARWDGALWHAVPGGPFAATRIGFLRDGRLVAAGADMAIRDTAGWQTILASQPVEAFVELPDGRIAATGALGSWNNTPGGPTRSAIWNGTGWQLLPYAHSIPRAITALPNGDVVVGAPFFNGERIARWDGAGWQPIGASLDNVPQTLTRLPNGQLVAGGLFTTSGGSPAPYLALFDGVNWLPLGVGSPVFRAHFAPDGRLHAATFPPTSQLLQRVTSCPASSVALSSGCTGGSPIELHASAWPYVGASYRAFATGAPSNALVLDVFGVSTNPTALTLALPVATPGCALVPAPDLYLLLLSGGGLLQSELALPNAAWLAGVMLWHQMLALQLDAQGNLTGAATSNALELRIGQY